MDRHPPCSLRRQGCEAAFGRPLRFWGPVGLPAVRLVDDALRVGHLVWELAGSEHGTTDRLVERAAREMFRRKRPTPVAVRVQHADWRLQVAAYEMDGVLQITVVRDHHRKVVAGSEPVDQQVAGEVDVRPLLLGDPNLGERRLSAAIRSRHCMASSRFSCSAWPDPTHFRISLA